ncbi:hypothetical protein H310_04911 [Aphanomyces invadans]|uniref:Uncharacterized protein n=1 Tax=Aphanomyces invadans TaxID=157072 RepID=A0A024UAM9_9STRA|nr:hypothetical protein H310_04911 [Aphanomyces invadans]ETW03451.1 hypothetical protein H310_04911 [Aphanomyces invadans]|eukprot:XP_008867680.1 hypothetical protein H310_04911 [Aphanomyces invadans]
MPQGSAGSRAPPAACARGEWIARTNDCTTFFHPSVSAKVILHGHREFHSSSKRLRAAYHRDRARHFFTTPEATGATTCIFVLSNECGMTWQEDLDHIGCPSIGVLGKSRC